MMFTNIFNAAGIAKSVHVFRTEKNIIYYGSSSNIMMYVDDEITPILRVGGEITGLEVRDGIILSDSTNRLEINNRFFLQLDESVTAVSKTECKMFKNTLIDICVFTTLSKLFIFSQEKVFSIEIKNTNTIDCVLEHGNFIVYCGSLNGFLYKLTIDLENIVDFARPSTNAVQNIESLFEQIAVLKKIEEVEEFSLYKIEKCRAHDDTISDVKWTEKFLITSSQDTTIKIFDRQNLVLLDTLLGHTDIVYDSFYDAENDEIISVGADNSVIFWMNDNGWKSGAKVGNISNSPFFSVVKVRTQNKDAVYIQGYHGSLYKYVDHSLKQSLGGHSDKITSLDLKDDLILTGSLDFTVRLYKDDKEIARPSIHGYPIKNAIFAGDLVSVGSEESIIRIYEETPAVRQLILGEFELKNIPIAMPSELSLTNETRQVESVSLNEHMLQNVLCFSEKKKIYGQFFSNSALAANHEIILCANKSANLKFSGIFVISVYKSVQYLAVHDLSVEKIEISPNGKFVVAVSRDRCISFYTVENKFIQSVADHALIDDKMQDGKKYIHLREKKKVHTRAITTLCINNDSSRFATASKDRTVKIHDVDTLDCIESIELDNEATSLRFLDNLLIVGQCDGNLSVYTDKLQKIFQKRIHSQKITEIRCAPGKIVTVADDWLIRVFKISDPNMHVSTSMRPIELN